MPHGPRLLQVYPSCPIVALSGQDADFYKSFSFWNGTLVKTLLGAHPTSGVKLIIWDSYPMVLGFTI